MIIYCEARCVSFVYCVSLLFCKHHLNYKTNMSFVYFSTNSSSVDKTYLSLVWNHFWVTPTKLYLSLHGSLEHLLFMLQLQCCQKMLLLIKWKIMLKFSLKKCEKLFYFISSVSYLPTPITIFKFCFVKSGLLVYIEL